MTDEHIFTGIIEGDNKVIREIYVTYRTSFLAYAQKFQIDNEAIIDIYHDAIIALHENIVSGKITDLNCSLKTYLFSIGKYKIYAHLRSQKQLRFIETEMPVDSIKEVDVASLLTDDNKLSEQQEQLRQAIKKLGDRCRNILELFYYRGMKIGEIKKKENYQNENTVKSQKSRCLKKLKELIFKG